MSAADARRAATEYARRGWMPIPVPRGAKAPRTASWQKLRIDAASLDKHFPSGKPLNVGVLLGQPSGDLVDVDLDSREAIAIADEFLPPTGAVFGRASKQSSHRLYVTEGASTTKFALGETVHVEIRATGAQTIFPGSEHKSGEQIEWVSGGEPAAVSTQHLEQCVRRVAAAALLIEHYPEKGQRDDLALAMHGLLGKAGWTEGEMSHFVGVVADRGGATDVQSKASKAKRTRRKLDEGQPVAGFSLLARIVGEQVASKFCAWVGIDPQPSAADVLAAIARLSPKSTDADVVRVVDQIASAKLAPLVQASSLAALQHQTQRLSRDLKKQFAASVARDRDAGPDEAMRLARELLRRHFADGKHLVRDASKAFWAYRGTHWERVPEEQLQKLAIALAEAGGARNVGATVRAAIDNLRGLQFREGDPMRLTSDPAPIVNCLNGELWLTSSGAVELRPHRPESFLTYVLNVPYDPSSDCPLFDEALAGIFRDASDPAGLIQFIWEFIGYAIQPQRPIAAWFMLHGRGRNGKTKLVETIQRLLDRRAVSAQRIADLEENKFAIGELVAKLLLVDDDVDAGTRLPDGTLKKISEQKLMTGQVKYGASFEFVARCLPVLLANNHPSSRDLSLGLRRRAQIIPFKRSFEKDEDDSTLFPRIWQTEMPGVLNKAIRSLRALLARGAFLEPVDVKAARRAWLASANPLAAFAMDVCPNGPTHRCSLKDFYEAFVAWAEETGVKFVPSKHSIGDQLEALGYGVVRVKGDRYLKGVGIKDEAI